jgi:hypothetical protein
LQQDWQDLARVLGFDLVMLIEDTVNDVLRNRLEELQEEFKD